MALVGPIEYDILHNKLGYTDENIRQMGDALADDIVADYSIGIERGPLVAQVEPAEAAEAAFLGGLWSDTTEISLALRGGLQRAGQAVGEIAESGIGFLKAAPYIAVGILALFILTRK